MGLSLSSITFTSSDADSVETVITIGGRLDARERDELDGENNSKFVMYEIGKQGKTDVSDDARGLRLVHAEEDEK